MALDTKRAYKLQEFVAHSSNVNCLKIGRKTSRVLLTGGEDHKVNLWAIGKPNSILSLSGHTSPVESVNFDSAEVLVAAGAASGTIKLWDLGEAKIVRTLTGHRSNCMSVDFHPFGEFFASGSLDTNLKIWDIRRKGCIHTYKGHTRGVYAIRFTPDGRWVVSGGEDNAVKIWDLTAGKLLQDFKCHEGQIQCIDFHPHEFLLATGSADKTVKFWDLETFEMIGSTLPEGTGVRSMTFNPDGRSLLCGFHESLKVFSWEPIICHDAVDVGWSRLSDLNVHEGKLIGCSFNQSCVGVWVVDLSRVEPYATGNSAKLIGQSGLKASSGGNMPLQNESGSKANIGRLSALQNSENDLKPSSGRVSVSQNSDSAPKEIKPVASSGLVPSTPQKTGIGSRTKTIATSALVCSSTTSKRNLLKIDNPSSLQTFNKADVVPISVPRSSSGEDSTDSRSDAGDVIPVFPKASRKVEPATDSAKGSADVAPAVVPRTSTRMEMSSDSRKEPISGRVLPYRVQSRYAELRKLTNAKVDSDRADNGTKHREPDDFSCQIFLPWRSGSTQTISSEEESSEDVKHVTAERSRFTRPSESNPNYCNENYGARVRKPRDNCYIEVSRAGRMRSTVCNWDSRDQSPSHEGPSMSASSVTMAPAGRPYSSRGRGQAAETPSITSDEDTLSVLMEQHELFFGSIRSRLTKLQIVRQMWDRKDVRGVIATMEKMSDHAISADVVSVLMERSEAVTLDLCACLLPVLTDLLESKTDRHLIVSLEMLGKLVRTFGPVIHSTVSADPSSVGVDLHAEERRERCNLCFIELEKVKSMLPSLTRRKGAITNTANELSLALQEVELTDQT